MEHFDLSETETNNGVIELAAYVDSTELGGAEQSLAALLTNLDERFRVTLIGTDEKVLAWIAERARPRNTMIVRAGSSKWNIRAAIEHIRTIRRLRPDILFLNLRHPYSCQWALVAGLLASGVRVVAIERFTLAPTNLAQTFTKRLLSPGLSAHIAASDHAARWLEQAIGLRPGSIRTIYNGVGVCDAESPVRRREQRVLGSAARLVDHKGLDTLIRALPLVRDARLVVWGEGRERRPLGELAARLGVADRVDLPGRVENAAGRMVELDLFVLPSRVEPFGRVFAEAMVARVPVIGTRTGGIPEVVKHGETGLLVEPDDPVALAAAINELLDDPERRASMGERGRAHVLEHFTEARMTRAYERLFDEVIGRPAAALAAADTGNPASADPTLGR